MPNTLIDFLDKIKQAIDSEIFVKLTLSKSLLKDDLQNVYVKPVIIKDISKFSFTYRYERRDETKNFDYEQTMSIVHDLLEQRFLNGALFTLTEDVSYLRNAKGNSKIISKKIESARECSLEHDRVKSRLIDSSNPWWYYLGMTTKEGKVLADMQHKYKQICKYTEIVDGLITNAKLPQNISIVDMGAGKGYLTFALHEFFTSTRKLNVDIKGVEIRPDLVKKINNIIAITKLKGIEFIEGAITNYYIDKVDILIALHACNTATDDAIAAGINSGAQMILCAPCCHKQIRQEMEHSGKVDAITQYGIFMERQAVMITDSIRALILEYYGYKTQILEFIEMEHTPKNILLVGIKSEKEVDKAAIIKKINDLKQAYGIEKHYLETILKIS